MHTSKLNQHVVVLESNCDDFDSESDLKNSQSNFQGSISQAYHQAADQIDNVSNELDRASPAELGDSNASVCQRAESDLSNAKGQEEITDGKAGSSSGHNEEVKAD